MKVISYATASAALMLATQLVSPAQNATWGHSFSDDSTPPVPFSAGALLPLSSSTGPTSGYALQANSQTATHQVLSLSRFDSSGGKLWDTRLDPGVNADGVDLIAVAEDSSRFYASLDELGNTGFRIGLFEGADSSPVFVKSLSKSALVPHRTEFFSGTKIGGSLDQGNSIDAFVLDGNGDMVFDKRYTSPLFANSGPLLTQSYLRGLVASRNLYLTSVSQVITEVVGTGFSTTVRLIPFFTDLSGEVTSAGSISFSSGFPTPVAFPSQVAGDALLYRIPATLLTGPAAGTQVTHLIKINSGGTVDWAKTLSGGTFLATFPMEESVYLAGTVSQPGGGAGDLDAAVVQIDLSDGSILSQSVFGSIDDIDNPTIVANASNVFVAINSTSTSNPESATTTLVKLSSSLTDPSATRYQGDHLSAFLLPDGELGSFDRFVFSPSAPLQDEVRGISLDLNLVPLIECDLFASAGVSLSTPLTVSDLTVTSLASSVDDVDITTPLADSTLPVSSYEMVSSDICGPGSSPIKLSITQLANGNIELSFPTQVGFSYDIDFSSDLDGFSNVFQLLGTGNEETYEAPLDPSGSGFYQVTEAPLLVP